MVVDINTFAHIQTDFVSLYSKEPGNKSATSINASIIIPTTPQSTITLYRYEETIR